MSTSGYGLFAVMIYTVGVGICSFIGVAGVSGVGIGVLWVSGWCRVSGCCSLVLSGCRVEGCCSLGFGLVFSGFRDGVRFRDCVLWV